MEGDTSACWCLVTRLQDKIIHNLQTANKSFTDVSAQSGKSHDWRWGGRDEYGTMAAENRRKPEKYLLHCHFAYNESHMKPPGTEPDAPLWEASTFRLVLCGCKTWSLPTGTVTSNEGVREFWTLRGRKWQKDGENYITRSFITCTPSHTLDEQIEMDGWSV